MSYNLLNFPTGNLDGRVDTLYNILDYHRPHLLMIQELKTSQGLSDVTDRMNDLGYGTFEHGTFVPQVSSGGGGDFPLQQNIVFDTEIFQLKSESYILTDVRDINEFVLYINDPLLESGADTTFIYVYVAHLKSSTGADNQALRLAMVEDWVDHVSGAVPTGSFTIFAGDFNIYTNTEAAYGVLTDEDNVIAMTDVFASYGNWSGTNFSHKEILTQSTRENQIYNDGAGGGVDDRFDFILLSENMTNSESILQFEEGSFISLGNTGDCYNQSITDCDFSNPVPFDILRSMYYLSDHLPQVCNLIFVGNVAVDDLAIEPSYSSYIDTEGRIHFNIEAPTSAKVKLHVSDPTGRLLHTEEFNVSPSNSHFITTESFSGKGVIIAHIFDGERNLVSRLCALNR